MFSHNGKKILQYISDIHLERKTIIPTIRPLAPNIALCGDIGYPFELSYETFLKNISKDFDNVFLVAGNHEYWSDKYTMKDINERIKDICGETGITFLNNSSSYLYDYNIVGTTLWSDHPAYKVLHKASLKTITPLIAPNTIILSHYLPSYKLIHKKFQNHPEKSKYATDLEYMMTDDVIAWICGHSHARVEEIINGCYCGLNPYEEESGRVNKVD